MAIGLNSSWIRSRFDTSLAGLLAEFGQPEEIWLDLFPESMSEPHYRIELFYPSQGILIGGDGTAKVTGNRFTICAKSFSQGNYPPGLLLFPQNEGITHESLGSFLGDPDSAKNFHRLRGLTADFNEADFYQAYNNPSNNACFNLDLTKIPERNPN